jgi:hypothetical protein
MGANEMAVAGITSDLHQVREICFDRAAVRDTQGVTLRVFCSFRFAGPETRRSNGRYERICFARVASVERLMHRSAQPSQEVRLASFQSERWRGAQMPGVQ